jgi:hypothetical protein
MELMGFGYRLYPSYNGYNGVGGKGIDKMIDQSITKHDELPALSTGSPHRMGSPRRVAGMMGFGYHLYPSYAGCPPIMGFEITGGVYYNRHYSSH